MAGVPDGHFIRTAIATRFDVLQRLFQRPAQRPVQIGSRHSGRSIHSGRAMQVQGVYVGEESFHSLHALWQLPREFKAIKVGYGQIGKGHPSCDRRVPFIFDRTR